MIPMCCSRHACCLEQLEFDVSMLSDPEKILPRIEKESFDVILLDMNFRRGQTEGTEGICLAGKD